MNIICKKINKGFGAVRIILILIGGLAVLSNCSSSDNPTGVTQKVKENTGSTDSTQTDSTGNESISSSSFMVFDGTRFRNKPDMSQYGFAPIYIAYTPRLWDKEWNEVGPWELPSRDLVEEQAHEARKVNKDLMVYDIEHWPNQGDSLTLQKSIDNYSQVFDWAKEAEPDMNIGFFDTLPVKKRYMSTPLVQYYYQRWQDNNDKLKPLAKQVDAFYPQLYTYSKDQQQWVTNAKYTIKEARRYDDSKPVYVFLWPQYYGIDHEGLDGVYIDKEFWKLQLDTARKYADGIVIWFPYKTTWTEASKAPWWQITKEFIQELKR